MQLPWRILCLFSGLILAATAAASGSEENADPPKVQLPNPSFKPGASVTLQVKLKAPAGWHINEQVPVLFSFDREALKKAPFVLSKEKWEFGLKEASEEFSASIPLTVQAKVADGEYASGVKVECGICTNDGAACTFSEANISFVLQVRATAPKSETGQALSKGVISVSYPLSAPQ